MEQRDQGPEPMAEDIGRAAAEAAALAEAGDQGDQADQHGHGDNGVSTHEYAAGYTHADAHAYDQPAANRSKRWLVVTGAAVAALALAGTAAAIAGGSHSKSSDTTLNVAAGRTAQTPTLPATSDPATGGTDDTSSSSPTSQSTSSSSASKTPSSSSKPSTTPSTTPSSSSSPTADGGDCETTTHDTPADEAMKFSGMTKATQLAFLTAQKAAEAGGQSFVLNSGYRSAAYQQRIFDCWVKQLGSPQAARKYALPPSESAHVKGYAMDIAPPSAAAWLQSTNGQFGLCRRYEDETWHFEYQPYYKTKGCPALLAHP
jgi:LAS superfamily LD-carboxypeptidase LdcB